MLLFTQQLLNMRIKSSFKLNIYFLRPTNPLLTFKRLTCTFHSRENIDWNYSVQVLLKLFRRRIGKKNNET